MRVILDGREMGLDRLQHDINLMAQERVLSQIIGNHIAWFSHYQPVDVRRLESILGQAHDQYDSLPDDEKKWLDNLKDFYDDFRAFDWEKYRSLPPQEKNKYQLETAFSWAEKLQPLVVINEEFDDPAYFLQLVLTIEYEKGPNGIMRPKFFTDKSKGTVYMH